MARMVAESGRLVSFGSVYSLLVTTGPEGAEVWSRQVPFDPADPPGPFVKAASFPTPVTDKLVQVQTPEVGAFTQVRMFGALSGSPSGDGLLVDELFVPRLDVAKRRTYLTDCTEGTPVLTLETGGTWVRGAVASGAAVTRGLLYLGLPGPRWTERFPTFDIGTLVLSGVSDTSDLLHEITLVDRRADGWTTNTRLDAGMSLAFVVLVWDSEGSWDFTWKRLAAMPITLPSALPAPDLVKTKIRTVTLSISKMVCLDDSDDLSYGEASFDVTMRPSVGPPQVKSFGWDPMASGSELVITERFTVTGPAAAAPALSVHGVEDDSGSPLGDEPDVADSNVFRPLFVKGPVVETFTVPATLDAQGGDDFHYQVHCSADVSYS